MGYGKWKPSKTAKREFAKQMDEISDYCKANGISCSSSMDSFYFFLNGKNYRISNHSIEASNAKAFNADGVQVREKYHGDSREANTVYIHASKTRLIEIYENIKNRKNIDGRGFEV